MTFIIVFVILYGLGYGVCRLTAMLFNGTDATLIKNVAFVPILNVIAIILIVFFFFYIVKDYRKTRSELNKGVENQSQIKK